MTPGGQAPASALVAVRPPEPGVLFDAPFSKRLVLVNGLVPAALLGWDALRGELGANGVNAAIHATGLAGLVLLLLSLAVTPIRRLTGWGRLIAVRRPLGLLAYFYLVIHFAIFFAFDRAGSVGSTFDEILARTYLRIGAIALALMTALAATSTDKMVLRLGAKRWKALHRLAYAIAILGVIHFLLLVKSDIRLPRALAIVLGVLLLFRVVRHYMDLRDRAARRAPAGAAVTAVRQRQFWTGELRVARIFQETPDVRTFRLAPVDGGALPFDYLPGQYLNLSMTIDGRSVRRSYTMASSPTRGESCELTVKRAPDGLASHHLHDTLREGDMLRVSAPAGRFVFTGKNADRVLFLAGGVGITPLMSMVRYLTDRAWSGAIYLAIAVKTRADVIFQEELGYLERRFPNFHVVTTVSRPDPAWTGRRGHLSEGLLRELVPDLGHRRVPVFLCGPEPMMRAAREMLATLAVPEVDISTEAFVSPPGVATTASMDGELGPEPGEWTPEGGTIEFARSSISTHVAERVTLLEAAESVGVDIPFECRSGICGQCKTRLTSGRVVMEATGALSATDRSQGLVLACQARPRGPIRVDA